MLEGAKRNQRRIPRENPREGKTRRHEVRIPKRARGVGTEKFDRFFPPPRSALHPSLPRLVSFSPVSPSRSPRPPRALSSLSSLYAARWSSCSPSERDREKSPYLLTFVTER